MTNMHLAFWLLGLLLLLQDILNVTPAAGPKLHPRQGNYCCVSAGVQCAWLGKASAYDSDCIILFYYLYYKCEPYVLTFVAANLLQSLGDYEIVTPTRVNEFGEVYPNNMHFRRKKRNVSPSADPDPWDSSSTHYRLSAFGQKFLFNLSANSGFIAPVLTVSLYGEPERNMTDYYNHDTDFGHCFYTGHVNTRTEHIAVISLCSGMVSLLSLLHCIIWDVYIYRVYRCSRAKYVISS